MIVLLTTLAHASIELGAAPTVGDEIVVSVVDGQGRPARGETVRVIHRPGLPTEEERAIGISDARGRVTWTPDRPGRFALFAGDQRFEGRVPYPQPPPEPMVGLLLLVGAAFVAVVYGWRRRARLTRRRR